MGAPHLGSQLDHLGELGMSLSSHTRVSSNKSQGTSSAFEPTAVIRY